VLGPDRFESTRKTEGRSTLHFVPRVPHVPPPGRALVAEAVSSCRPGPESPKRPRAIVAVSAGRQVSWSVPSAPRRRKPTSDRATFPVAQPVGHRGGRRPLVNERHVSLPIRSLAPSMCRARLRQTLSPHSRRTRTNATAPLLSAVAVSPTPVGQQCGRFGSPVPLRPGSFSPQQAGQTLRPDSPTKPGN
jgi:hypothetical protein